MSSDPTDTPTTDPTPEPTPVAADGTFVDFVATQRLTVAWILIALGLASLTAALFCGYRYAYPPGATAADTTKGDPAVTVDGEEGLSPPRESEYLAGAMAGLIGTFAGAGVGLWLMAGIPKLTVAERHREARAAILLAGSLFGFALMALGTLLFYLWFDDLLAWVDRGVATGAQYPLLALMVFLVGAGLMFLAAQPARAEERNNPLLRRLVYGTNLGLTTVLLVLLLVVGNVFAALRLPATLDTTETGLHTLALSDPTREYVAGLDETILVYAILPPGSSAVILDTRRLLDEVKATNPAHVEVRYLDEKLNSTEITQLHNDYPQVTDYGLLLTIRGNDKQSAFIALSDMVSRDPVAGTGEARTVFRGEGEFARELLAMTEESSQPVVYFTQSAGELAVPVPAADGGPAPADRFQRPAAGLRRALEGINCRTETLAFDPAATDPNVPADATIVVIADPTATLSDPTVAAIRKFMTTPGGPDGQRKGRLLVMAGAHPRPDGEPGVMPTGLESLLAEFGILLFDSILYGQPNPQSRQTAAADTLGVTANPTLYLAGNPLAVSLAGQRLPVSDVRPVQAASRPPASGAKSEVLLITGERRATWLESDILANPDRTWEEMVRARSPDVFQAKMVSGGARPVAAIASDDAGGRVVVYGFGDFFSDETTRQLQGRPVQADLFAASVNWLRDRPAVANIPSKTYGEYSLDQNADVTQLYWLPVGLCMLAIVAVGLGVLVLRRA